MTKGRETKDDARYIVLCTFEDEQKGENMAGYTAQTGGLLAGSTRRHEGRSFGEPAFYEFVPAEAAEVVG